MKKRGDEAHVVEDLRAQICSVVLAATEVSINLVHIENHAACLKHWGGASRRIHRHRLGIGYCVTEFAHSLNVGGR